MSDKDEMNSKVEGLPLESVFETLGVGFTVIDLDWFPEEERDWCPKDEDEDKDSGNQNKLHYRKSPLLVTQPSQERKIRMCA